MKEETQEVKAEAGMKSEKKETVHSLNKYFTLLKILGADEAKAIDPRSVKTAPWPLFKCQYGCQNYGKSHCCPPKTPDWQQMQAILDCYEKAILFRLSRMGNLTEMAVKCARQMFLDGYYKAVALGSGPCKICGKCDIIHCRFPERAAPSMEACGIDVFQTARDNGFAIDTAADEEEPKNFFGLILIE